MKIRNKITGEIKEINESELSNYGISAPTETSIAAASTGTTESPLIGAINFLTGGAVSGIQEGVKRLKEEQPPKTLQEALNPVRTIKGFSHAMAPIVKPGIVMGTEAALLPYVLKAPRYLTKGGLAKIMEEEATKATKGGASADWDELKRRVTERVTSQFGTGRDVLKTLKTIFVEKEKPYGPEVFVPTKLKDPEVFGEVFRRRMSPEELLQWRQQLGERLPSVWEKIFRGTSMPEKVTAVARGDISGILKEIAPAEKLPSWLYSLYSKAGGDPVTWVKRLTALKIADTLGVSGGVANAIKKLFSVKE